LLSAFIAGHLDYLPGFHPSNVELIAKGDWIVMRCESAVPGMIACFVLEALFLVARGFLTMCTGFPGILVLDRHGC
jgi:hypothetical protein